MRERKDVEKKHLPASTYEAWLTQQEGGHLGRRRGKASPDAYEEWVEKKVRARMARLRQGARAA